MTRTELVEMRNAAIDAMIADGMDEDDARFAAMTAAARPDGILSEQGKSEQHPALLSLAKAGRAFLDGVEYVPVSAAAPRMYTNEDQTAIWVS